MPHRFWNTVSRAMTDTGLDPTSLPLRTPAPDDSVRSFTETLPTTLGPEVLWRELTRALLDSKNAVLWANDVSTVSTLHPPLAQGSVLAETLPHRGMVVYYRLKRFEPSRHLLEYVSLQGHALAGGATVSVERSAGGSTLLWKGEYHGTEANLAILDRFRAAFFGQLAPRLRQLESMTPTAV